MSSVVFLRGINVGGASLCRPAVIAKQLSKFDMVNIGAAGTFVVRENVSESVLRAAIAKKIPFKCEIMICSAKSIVDLTKRDPFAKQPADPDIIRFVNVLHKPLSSSLVTRYSSLSLPSDEEWLLKIIAIRDQFVLGIYRRQMKAIGCLGKIEKILGVPATNRNWNTFVKISNVLEES